MEGAGLRVDVVAFERFVKEATGELAQVRELDQRRAEACAHPPQWHLHSSASFH